VAWLSAKAPRRKPGAPGLPADLIRPRSQPAQIGGPDPGALASIDIIGTSRDVMLRATALSTFAYGRPYLSTWDVTRAVTDGFERVIWVFRGIDAIASNAASLEIVWRSGHPEKGEIVVDHPAISVLNGQTNVFEKSEAFIYRAFCIYLLSKRGCFIEIIRDNVGRPIALYILPPHLTNPIPHPERYVSAFRVLVPGGGAPVDVPAWEENGEPHVLWIRKPHPLDAYSSITPLESAGISIDTDYYARLYNRCLRQTEWVRLADGTRRRAGDLIGKKFKLLTATEDGQIQVDAEATAQAVEPIFRVTTESGRTLEVNGHHPLLAGRKTSRGVKSPWWTAVAELEPKAYVAVPSVFEARPNLDSASLTEAEAFVLGALVGDGTISVGQPVLSSPAGSFVETFIRAVEAIGDVVTERQVGSRVGAWGVRARLKRRYSWSLTRQLVERVGLYGCTSHTKFVPDQVFGASKAAQAAFLGGYFAADGCVSARLGRVHLSSVNRRLLADVQELLLRFGVCSRIYKVAPHALGASVARGDKTLRGAYSLAINCAEDVERFASQIAVPGKQEALDAALEVVSERLRSGRGHKWRTKNLPPGLRWERVDSVEIVGEDLTVGISVPGHHTYLGTFFEHNTFLQNDGRPGGILAVKGYLNELDSETLKRRFSGGQNAGKTAVVEADNISWLDLAATPRDAQYIEGLGVTKMDILLALGVPLSIIGDASGSTFDNSDAETRIFWVNTMGFHLSIFAGGLGALDPDPETYCAFDTSVIGVLQREREAQKTSDLALVKSYLMTPDEFRKRWGEVPFGTPASRALWVPSTMTPMPAKGDKIDDIVWGPPQPEPPPPPPPAVHVYQGGAVPAGPEAPPPPNGKQPPDVAAALAEAEAATNGKPPKAPAEPAAPKPKPKKDVEPGEVKVTLGHHGVMVAVYPSAETAEKLAVAGGEDPEDLHVTIAYLGKQDGFTADELAHLEATISAWAATEEPFVAEITGTGQFVADGDVPQIALVSSEHLAGLRHRLLARLEDEGLVLAG